MPDEQPEAYTVAEVGRLMGFSNRHIVRMFEREPGVLICRNRKRRTLRIPRAVFQRVYRRMTVR